MFSGDGGIKTNYSKNNIKKAENVIEISSNASSFWWEVVCNKIRTGGAFNLDEMEYDINTQDLLAANFSLKTIVKVPDVHVKLLSDNTTTVHSINNMHSNESDCVIPLYLKFCLGLRKK